MRIDYKIVAVVAIILVAGIGVGFLGGYQYRDSLFDDFVRISYTEYVELSDNYESPVPVYVKSSVWYKDGVIHSFTVYSENWGHGSYGQLERVPRGTVLRVEIKFYIDCDWHWDRSNIEAVYIERIDTEYIAGTRTRFFSNSSYGVYGYLFSDM